ncbi:uncharacterized protein DEA37_0011059 [Paragonimus westermani]|uniref:Shisa N-terminal domain-containing protein n=1 Tax=Paragonimus westermani TaxID=34504 RepID=A0A5J4NSP8_9TREM|nr:uncharacterized protein DEA37_0011059 [Paragonimus westermani]
MAQTVTISSVPSEVLWRYGGLTNKQKRALYKHFHSLSFVTIPEFLMPQIHNVEELDKFGVCKIPKGAVVSTAEYFVCPNTPSSSLAPGADEPRFCCGSIDRQYCCSSAEFLAGIRLIKLTLCSLSYISLSSALVVSPSIVMGTSLVFLLLSTLLAIFAYATIARRIRKQSIRLHQYSNFGTNRPHYDSKPSSVGLSSHAPPRNHLISARSNEVQLRKQQKDSNDVPKQADRNNQTMVLSEKLTLKQTPSKTAPVMKSTPVPVKLLSSIPGANPTQQSVQARPAHKHDSKRNRKM